MTEASVSPQPMRSFAQRANWERPVARIVNMLRITLPNPEMGVATAFHNELAGLGTLIIEEELRTITLMISNRENVAAVKQLLGERCAGFVEWTQEL